jgi:hypothetical protein
VLFFANSLQILKTVEIHEGIIDVRVGPDLLKKTKKGRFNLKKQSLV